MDPIKLRKQAVLMYLNDVSVTDICKTLNCSRPWVYKWLKRYESDSNGEWYAEQSRRPHTIHTRIDNELEKLIIKIRRHLEKTPYAQIGAISIQWELQKLQIEVPPIWTIDRIINPS